MIFFKIGILSRSSFIIFIVVLIYVSKMIHTGINFNSFRSTNVDYNGSWTKASWIAGSGYWIEGIVKSRRLHVIKAAQSDLPTRFLVLKILVQGPIMRREFDENGHELPPGKTQNEANIKGYLHKFEKRAAHATNTASINELVGFIKKLKNENLISEEVLRQLHPHSIDIMEFWVEKDSLVNLDLKENDSVRLKTLGDSILVDTVAQITISNPSSAGGSSLGENWYDKISKDASVHEKNDQERDDGEWD